MKKVSQKARDFFVLLGRTNSQFIPKKKRQTVLLILILLGITSQSWFVGSMLFSEIMNKLANQKSHLPQISLTLLVMLNLGSDIILRSLSSSKDHLKQKLSLVIRNQVQKIFWKSYTKYDLQDHESAKMQNALSNAQGNQVAISELLQTELDFIYNFAVLISALITLTSIVWWATIILVVILIPRLVLIWRRKARQYKNEKARQELGRYRSALSSFIGSKDARINGAQSTALNLFESLRKKMNFVDFKNTIHILRINLRNDILLYCSETILLLYLIHKIDSGVYGVGILLIFFSSFNRLNDSLLSISEKIATLGVTMKKVEDFYLVIDGKPAIVDQPNASVVDNTKPPMIEFRDVWFKYPENDDWILKGCNFTIRPGERVGLVAKNGEGKTTIALLLLRFYDVQQGAVLVNGIDVKLINRDSLFAITGVLFQDFRLLEGSIRFSIAAFNFKRKFSDHQLWKSLSKVGMSEYVEKLKHGLDHKISKIFSDSKKLSGGQTQKVGLAGIVCKEPQLLILDEFTSALDPQAESDIVKQYDDISSGRTCLIISHRYNTLDLVEKILILHEGRIAEEGNKTNLLKMPNGIFKALHDASRLKSAVSSN